MPRHFLASVALLLGTASQAESLGSVEVSSQSTARTDVHRACPMLRQRLQDGLPAELFERDAVLALYVGFTLQGAQASSPRLRHASLDTRRAIRDALRSAGCRADAQAKQRYGFMLIVVPDGQLQRTVAAQELAPSDQRLALGH